MAYLDPQRLTCPQCGLQGQVVWIVGLGPQTKPGDGPAYIRIKDAGPFQPEKDGARTRVFCPGDGALLTSRG